MKKIRFYELQVGDQFVKFGFEFFVTEITETSIFYCNNSDLGKYSKYEAGKKSQMWVELIVQQKQAI